MSCIVFILLGLAVCGFTHALFNSSRNAVIVDLGVAVIGAVTAGALFNHIAATGAAVVSITDAFVAAVTGAVGLLAAYHATLRHATLYAVSPAPCELIKLPNSTCTSGLGRVSAQPGSRLRVGTEATQRTPNEEALGQLRILAYVSLTAA
jgi:uncharacterized membrane protein YeaQ/YmgE (transglycosylase-associated protein family)